jgi:uncharacterized protein (DUF433 family)
MCARDRTKPRSSPRGIRLPGALDDAIQREAEKHGKTWSALTTELLEEALRLRHAPGIAFVDGPTGRRAVVAGTGIDVWEVVATWKALGGDTSRTREAFSWLSEIQVRSALGYYERYPEEIEHRLAREEAWTPERLLEELPFARPHGD